MRLFRRRRHAADVQPQRAELLDDALSSWQTGDHPSPEFDGALESVEPLGDALAAAQALDALAAGEPLPHEPLVALRAALAAKSKDRVSVWRRALAHPRLAPAFAAVLAAVVAVGVLTTVQTSDEPLTQVAAAKAEAFLETAQNRVAFLEAQTAAASSPEDLAIDPAELSDAVVEAQSAAASARAAAQLASGDDRKTLLAQVELQQRQINALRTKVLLLAGAPNLVPDAVIAASTTTTTVRPTTTTTTVPATTTTTVKPTTTTVKPTTTTTAPTTTTEPPTTTTAPATTTTTEPEPPRGKAQQDPPLP